MTTTRYPNQFRIKGSGSQNILSIGAIPRCLGRSHSWALAAWLVTYLGDMPSFLNVLIDVWASRFGEEQIPDWLRAACPDWTPHEPPARQVAPQAAPPAPPLPRPVHNQNGQTPQPVPSALSRKGSGPAIPRLTLTDGSVLDASGIQAVAEENEREIRERREAARRSSPGTRPAPSPSSSPDAERGHLPVPLPVPLDEGDGSEV
jgi:hypothetical protein